MSDPGRFAAQILETSAPGFAGLVAGLLLERHPEIAGRYGTDAFGGWKSQAQRWLLDLSAAVDSGEPKLFQSRARWAREAFDARKVPVEDLRAALVALRDVLQERLPAAAVGTTIPVVDGALSSLADSTAEAASGPGRAAAAARPALDYLEAILAGHPREAIDRLLRSIEGDGSIRSAYLEVLMPAQREVGRMWHAGELSIAEEHLVTATTQRAMSALCERGQPATHNGKTVLLACVAGNVHDLGVRAIADFFEMAGWRVINLGPDTPIDEIARSVRAFDADLVVLSAALDPQIKPVRLAIERIRALGRPEVKVIVGGPAFQDVPDLWRKFGADGHAARLEDVEPLGSQLVR